MTVSADPRIEAAARRYHFATAPIGPSGVTEWEDVPTVRQIVCRTIASDILQAADLAAADAVLTPPDVYEQVGWVKTKKPFTVWEESPGEGWEPVFRRVVRDENEHTK